MMAIDLPELSAKICSLHGTHRSQYVATATTEIIQSITAMLRQSSRDFSNTQCFHSPLGIPAEIVYDISEVCAPLVDAEEVRPLGGDKDHQVRIQCLYSLLNVLKVEALLQCNIGAALPGSNKRGLSPTFVSSVRDKNIKLSYSLQVALWTKDISAFEHCVMSTIKLVTDSDLDIEQLLTRSHLPQACCQHLQLFYHIRDLLKTALIASRGVESVVNFIKTFHKLFRRELTQPQSKQLVPSSLHSYYPSHLHSLLYLMTTTMGYEIDELWRQIDDLLNAAGNTYNLRTDMWLLLVEFGCWRDDDAQRLQLSSHDHREPDS